MSKNQSLKTQINIYVPMAIRERLQVIAAKKMLKNPQKNYTAAGVAGGLVVKNIEKLEKTI